MSPDQPQAKSEQAPADQPEKAAAAQAAPLQAAAPHVDTMGDKAGKFAYRHKDFFNGNLGWFTVKQGAASVLASFNMMVTAIPTRFGLQWLHDKAKLNVKAAEEKGVEAGEFSRIWAKPGVATPLTAIAFVATGFTMYRGTRKIFNKLYEKIFTPDNGEQKTIDEMKHLPHSLKEAVAEVMPAESQSTPFGAIALGGIRSLYQGPQGKGAEEFIAGKQGAKWSKALVSKGSNFKEQAIIDILGYSAFFELSDRLYKDIQLRREKWHGEPNSIAPIKHSAMDDKAPAGDDDPSLKRLVFRRIIPTAMGITAYTVTHRASKMLTGAPEAAVVDAPKMLNRFIHNFGAEWAAIGTFFIHSAVAEKYEKAYDALWTKINDKHHKKEVAVG